MLREREREWIAEATGAVPLSATPLAGGTHAETFLISPQDLVLRRFPPEDGAAAREQRILPLLAQVAGPFPRLVAADPDGDRTGSPCVLVSRLPGKADVLPDDPSVAARELASALARLHAADLPADSGLRDLTDRVRARRPEILPAPLGGPVFSHGDFWSGNVLWSGGRVTAVIDWEGAGLAPRGYDVAWCRFDLYLLHGRAVADEFAAHYERTAGVELPDLPAWDRFAARWPAADIESWTGNYAPLGRPDLTPAELRRLHTAWLHMA